MSVRYYIHVGMNRPTVNTPEAVQGILEQYDVRPELQVVPANEADRGVLAFLDDENMLVDWPSAVPADPLPSEADYESDEERWEAEDELHKERGQQGLTDLLLALAPYLKTPLIIQAASFASNGEFYDAKEWTVQPGATEVEVKEIVGMDDEHSIVEMS